MSTKSLVKKSNIKDPVCQGDIFRNIKYNYIDTENDNDVEVVEYEFPLAIIISQACDVISMEKMLSLGKGKPTKFMPSILMCPIYDEKNAKSGEHIEDAFDELFISFESDQVYNSKDKVIAEKDWHYRFHLLELAIDGKTIMSNKIMDFKHYFSVPMSYLIKKKEDRIYHMDDLFSEQLTLKFANYLSRVAIP